jgi:hypothetical protein
MSRLYHGSSGTLWCIPVQLERIERAPDLKLSMLPSSGVSGREGRVRPEGDSGEPPCRLGTPSTSLQAPAGWEQSCGQGPEAGFMCGEQQQILPT